MKISVFYDHIYNAARKENKSLEFILQSIAPLGIQAVDLELCQFEQSNNLKTILRSAGYSVASIYHCFDFGYTEDKNGIKHLINTAIQLETKNILCIPGFIKQADRLNTVSVMDRMASSLQMLVALAAEENITVSLEDYDNSSAPYSTIGGLQWFITHVPGLGITFDTGNFTYSGENELDAFNCLQEHIVHVHLKDRSLKENHCNALITKDGRSLYPSPVGSGFIRIDECIHKLIASGYENYFTIEHFGSNFDYEYIRKSAEFLSKYRK